eukprot:3633332-Alexandrium_andersonii.AAC.2
MDWCLCGAQARLTNAVPVGCGERHYQRRRVALHAWFVDNRGKRNSDRQALGQQDKEGQATIAGRTAGV